MLKTCKICGREFEATQSNYKICSEKCRKLNREQLGHDWYCNLSNHQKTIYRKRSNEKRKKTVLCKICGKPTPAEYNGNSRVSHRHYCDNCVIDQAINAITSQKGKERYAALGRAYAYGYTKNDMLKVMEIKNGQKRN